jgi:hypothetical protein
VHCALFPSFRAGRENGTAAFVSFAQIVDAESASSDRTVILYRNVPFWQQTVRVVLFFIRVRGLNREFALINANDDSEPGRGGVLNLPEPSGVPHVWDEYRHAPGVGRSDRVLNCQ